MVKEQDPFPDHRLVLASILDDRVIADIKEEERRWKLQFREWSTNYIVDWKLQYERFLKNTHQCRDGS
ncbi:hypothetical protein LSH36_499g01061 [Paralvinella palmiformis]|uniref:Uncharacterized protein n=1 Tax=Paralvinella palmiformis TaxID=53620 RepID=A0AAD9J9M0_9ANNE|nr:hypothetical protein LSH36_499g01061 [Paralvinella palmiformis]